ncbi:hypothetical protein B0H11DRAFT_2007244 [Mycena galericulata]|nr:hypothetical protein B0H11DRAFT_2007244 [Mycena galericulata]
MASASASESSSFISSAHGTWTPPASETRRRKNRTRGRNSVPDAAYEAHIAAANPDELELSSDEEDEEEVGKAGGGREARASAPTAAHGRESSDEARVPGRWPWGLLTPAGSVAVRAAGNVSHAASWPGSASTSPAVRSNGNGNSAHAHLQLSKGPAGGRGAMHDEPNALLLAGAVGVGAMLVAAAWWGA